MELEQAKKRAAELREVIEKNNRLYYDQDAPELEDYQYDALVRELKGIEAEYPQLVTPASPTQHVGGTASSKFSKVAHAVKMESLQDAFSFDELREFDARVREAGITPEYVVEVKIDGLSVSLGIPERNLCAGFHPRRRPGGRGRHRKPGHHPGHSQAAGRRAGVLGGARRGLHAPRRLLQAERTAGAGGKKRPSKTPATPPPARCGRRTPRSPPPAGCPSLCSTCSRCRAAALPPMPRRWTT